MSRWWLLREHKSTFLEFKQNFADEVLSAIKRFTCFAGFLSLSNGRKNQITWLNACSMRGFDVKINFKSLYNSLLISRVFLFFFQLGIHYHLENFPQLINAKSTSTFLLSAACTQTETLFFITNLKMQIDEKAAKCRARKKVDFNLFPK